MGTVYCTLLFGNYPLHNKILINCLHFISSISSLVYIIFILLFYKFLIDINFFECFFKIIFYQRAHLLRFFVISVVISG